jgi:ABC-type multidrug transport system ATPase subunit/pSer/pThr/pTyr-binding forkhead associated (FHA) protein
MDSIRIYLRSGSNVLAYDLGYGTYSLGRSSKAQIQTPSEWTIVSGLHLQIRYSPGQVEIIDGYEGAKSTNGTRVNNRYIPNREWTSWAQSDDIEIGTSSRESIKITWSDGSLPPSSTTSSPVTGDVISIGRSNDCNVCINGPTISRVHCVIRRINSRYVIYDYSSNGVFLNEVRIVNSHPLADGDEIKVGTHIFSWSGGSLSKQTSGASYRIDVRQLSLASRISNANISIEPGQLVAFVGGSGAGKSSLLTTIVGQNMDYTGNILINGSELRDCYSSIKQEIGFVPQDDIVHLDLTVEEVLRYSALLKLPDPEQRRDAVDRVIDTLELSHRRTATIKSLSGGQRKRVSIGVELIADPRILFLDEPTSGLDPGLDKRMMYFLRKLADNGQTVALVTHATNNVRICDQVVFLGRGGYVCYAGPPDDCNSYFGVDGDFSDIYQSLERPTEQLVQLAEDWRATQGKLLPNVKPLPSSHSIDSYSSFLARVKDFPRQTAILLSRDYLLTSRDLVSITLNSLTAPVAVLMVRLASDRSDTFSLSQPFDVSNYSNALTVLFVVVCSSIWVALSSSLQVLVKERPIFVRERGFNLLPESYLTSKYLVMASQALLQSVLISISFIVFFEAPTSDSNWLIPLLVSVFTLLLSVGSQSLMVSSLVVNSQQAASIAPLLLIPQLVFGGILFNLSDSLSWIYSLISSRWAMRAIGSIAEVRDLLPSTIPAAIDAADVDVYVSSLSNTTFPLFVMVAQGSAFAVVALASLLFLRRNR